MASQKKVFTGEKAKLVNVADRVLADERTLAYTIDIVLAKSPKKGVKCGAVIVYAPNHAHLDLDPIRYSAEMVERLTTQTKDETEVIHREPEFFRETDGQWIPWAIERALELYDKYGGHARISIKCPALRIREVVSSKSIASGRGDTTKLFKTAWEINRLLDRGYQYDPWTKKIRRGRINAKMSKR